MISKHVREYFPKSDLEGRPLMKVVQDEVAGGSK